MLSNLNVIPSFELNVMVKVKVVNSVDGTCKVKRSLKVVVEYGGNSVPILRIISIPRCEAQDTGIRMILSHFKFGVDYQIKGDFEERSPFVNCSQLVISFYLRPLRN